MKKICVIGQGYIGLPTAILFAKNNFNVIGVDINKKIVSKLNKGIPHITENHIDKELKYVITKKSYFASLTPEKSDIFIITVPTPYISENYNCDLSYVINACESILPYLEKNNIIIIESTISPMSTDEIIKPIFENYGFIVGQDIFLAHCPERVLPGKIFHELVYNNRIIGGVTEKCSQKAAEVYESIVKGEIIQTEAKTAELSKCMENTFRDVNIALVNELVKICAKINVNALDVIKLANKHPRVNLHSPGPGVGGHCLAIDPYFIYGKVPEEAKIIKLARDTNNSMPQFIADFSEKILNKHDPSGNKISIFGLSYKGNTDDDRESPSYDIINILKSKKFEINIFDPHIKSKSVSDYKEAIANSSLVLILCDHDEYKSMNYADFADIMKTPIIFDTKNLLDSIKLSNDIIYYNLGNIYSI